MLDEDQHAWQEGKHRRDVASDPSEGQQKSDTQQRYIFIAFVNSRGNIAGNLTDWRQYCNGTALDEQSEEFDDLSQPTLGI